MARWESTSGAIPKIKECDRQLARRSWIRVKSLFQSPSTHSTLAMLDRVRSGRLSRPNRWHCGRYKGDRDRAIPRKE